MSRLKDRASIWAVVIYGIPSTQVSAQAVGEEAKKRQQSLTDSLTEGKVFYTTTSRHDPEALGFGMPDHIYPKDTTDETWMLVGENGTLDAALTKVYSPEGTLIATSRSGGGTTVYYDLIADEVLEFPDMTGGNLVDSLGELWRFSNHLEGGGYTSSSTGVLRGETSVSDGTLSILQGTVYQDGCQFQFDFHLEVGETAVGARERAYDPDTCRVLVEYGTPTAESDPMPER